MPPEPSTTGTFADTSQNSASVASSVVQPPLRSSGPTRSLLGSPTRATVPAICRAVCSPDLVTRPPLDTHLLYAKLHPLFMKQQRNEELELPCHREQDPWDSNSTPPSSFWLTNAAASPSAIQGGKRSTATHSPPWPKTPSPPTQNTGSVRKRNHDAYDSDDGLVRVAGKRQKRWLAG